MTGFHRSRNGRLIAVAFLAGVAAAAAAGDTAVAQESAKEEKKPLIVGKWYPALETGLLLSQSAYSDNWAGGDKGSMVWTAIANGGLENQISAKANWKSTLKLAFGQTHQQVARLTPAADDSSRTEIRRSWDRPEKSTDLIDAESVLRLTLGGFVDPFVAGRFESQFQDATDPEGRILAVNPIRLRESAGVARQFIKTEERELLSRLGFSFRQGIRRVYDEPAPGDKVSSESTNDGGVEWVTEWKSKVLDKRIAWTSKLIAYQPVFYSGQDALDGLTADDLSRMHLDADLADFSTAMDLDWENIFSSQITKVLSVSLYTRLLYDKYDNTVKPIASPTGGLANPDPVRQAVRKAGQFKQTLSIGVTYRFL
jgi:hypothetical protein